MPRIGKWRFVETVKGYKVWRKQMGGIFIYNVTKNGKPPGLKDGGYPNKNALLKLKGLI